jgi:hypothetical protein
MKPRLIALYADRAHSTNPRSEPPMPTCDHCGDTDSEDWHVLREAEAI